jgi:carboxyl-terminal processing protease
MQFKKLIAVITGAVMLCSSFAVSAADSAQTDTVNSDIVLSGEYVAFDQIAEYVSERYLDSDLSKEDIKLMGISSLLEDNETMLVELLKSTLTSLDPYSDFFTADEYQKYIDQINQTFYGIGVYLQESDGYVEITGFVEEGGTAEQVGLEAGDKIIKVDGTNVVGKGINEVRNRIAGEYNTDVLLTVLRDGKEIEITAHRVAVSQSTVSGGIMKGNIGYISIKSFGANTASEFESIMKQLQENNVKKLILDLRDNPGGFVDAATDIAKMIVPHGKIVTVSYRNEEENTVEYSEVRDTPFNIIALVNENTASSSEILSSAIQDSGAGKLLGTQTYGKAVVQQLYSVANGSMIIKLTTGQYLTRNGREINGIGLEPDYYVTNYKKQIDTTQYTPFDFQNRYAIGQNGNSVKAAKERLKLLGYYSGNTDDTVFNADLQNAVKSFQSEVGLSPDGVLDIATQVKLKEQFETLETVVDRQLQTAYEKFGGNVEDLY